MTTVDNEKERAFWNGAGGETWVRAQAQLDQMLAPLLDALLAGAALQPGRRVLDLGCGCGASSLAAAESGAEVVGLDFSAPMISLAEARGRLRRRGLCASSVRMRRRPSSRPLLTI